MKKEPVSLPQPIQIYWIGTLTLTAIAFLIVGLRRFVSHEGYPYNTLFFIPDIAFSDFTIYAARFEHFGTASFVAYPGHPFTYPAPLAVIYAFYFSWCPNPSYAFLATIIAATLIGAALMIRALRDAGLSVAVSSCLGATILLTSYPMMFLLDRGNVEIFAWIALAAGLVAVVQEKPWIAATLIGLAAAMKLVPGIFLLLLLYRKRYREFVFGIFIAVATTVTSLWVMGPTIPAAYVGIQQGLDRFRTMYVFHWRPWEFGFDHSLFSTVKEFKVLFSPTVQAVSVESLRHSYKIYTAVVAIVLILILWRLTRLPYLNQLLVLACSALVFPPLSADYTLVHLYVPLVMLLLFTIRSYEQLTGLQRKRTIRLFCYFAVLLTPQAYLISRTVGFGGQVKVVVLVLLMVESLMAPLADASELETVSAR